MARVVTLGTAAAVADEAHANTYLAVEGDGGFWLVDCGESPLVRIRRAGLLPECLRGLIITHFHPDHVIGVPILLMNVWLLGRSAPLSVYGLPDALERFETMMGLFRWEEWPDFFPVICREVDEDLGAPVLESDDLQFTGAPVQHLVPTIGLRIRNKRSGRVLAYSSDTSPCDAAVALARDASILIHEAAKNTPGHSSAAQAGEIARRAAVDRLVLIHYRPTPQEYHRWLAEAATAFGGPVELACDLGEYVF